MSKQLKNEEMEAKVMDEELDEMDEFDYDFDETFDEDEDECIPAKKKHSISTAKVKKAVKHYGPKILKGIGIGVALGLAYTIGVAAGESKRQDNDIYDLNDDEYVELEPEQIRPIERVPAIEEVSEPEPIMAVEVHEEVIEENS